MCIPTRLSHETKNPLASTLVIHIFVIQAIFQKRIPGFEVYFLFFSYFFYHTYCIVVVIIQSTVIVVVSFIV